MTTYATTPKGRKVEIRIGELYGTRNQSYQVWYGCLHISGWIPVGSGNTTMEQALIDTDTKIDASTIEVVEAAA